jgi:YD repeat-containing protein
MSILPQEHPSNVTVTPTAGAAINAANAATTWKAKVDVGAGVNEFTVSATQANVPQGQTAQSTTRTLQVPVGSIPGGDAAYQYDADGNMLTDGQRTYTWDAENRLVAVVIPSNGRVEFSYDAFNRRAYEAVKPDGVNATRQLTMMWEGLTVVGQLDGAKLGGSVRISTIDGTRELRRRGRWHEVSESNMLVCDNLSD